MDKREKESVHHTEKLMKKTTTILCLLFTCLLAIPALAQHDVWPRSYFIQAGFDVGYSFGDLNDRFLKVTDTLGEKVSIHPPTMDLLLSPDITLGSNVGAFTVAVNFQFWKSTRELSAYDGEDGEVDSRIWRLGFEFSYNFLWPDYFQIGIGGSYSYTNIKTQNSAFFPHYETSSELYGSSAGLFVNASYFFDKHLAIVPSIKVYENWFKNVFTTQTEVLDLHPYLWQTFVQASVAVRYQF